MVGRRYALGHLFVGVVLTTLAMFLTPVMQRALQKIWTENSTDQRRISPNEIASKAGSLIRWETDIDEAFRKSAASGKPVFWYVPRLPDTFMDRVKSLDMYMKAGPFSWPKIILSINRSFIPLLAVPDRTYQRRFNLKKYKFIEPGFLVVTGATSDDTKVIQRTDRLTTLHIPWLEKMIAEIETSVGKRAGVDAFSVEQDGPPEWLYSIRQEFFNQNYAGVVQQCEQHREFSGAAAVERDLRLAMATFRLGKQQTASALFANVAAGHPGHPLGHKAAAEAQGIGPFVRGFEIHSTIPEAAMKLTASSGVDPSNPIYAPAQIQLRSVDYLLSMQDESGGFFDSDYDFGGADSLPNVHVAVTAICGLALLEQLHKQTNPKRRAAIESAVVRAGRFSADNSNLVFTDRDEIFWAFAYRLELWTAIARSAQTAIAPEESGPVIERCLDDLVSIQAKSGSWFHEYTNPFVTATGIMSLHRAKAVFDVASNQRAASALPNAARSLSRQRHRGGTFSYQDRPSNKNLAAPHVQAAAGRMPLCEAALFVEGRSSLGGLQTAIEASFKHHQNLDAAYKYDNHTDHWAYGGFFFWFDMRGRKQAIELLPKSDMRTAYRQQLEAIVISKAEIDGCFVDSHEIGRCYGTAMALLCLEK